MGFYTRLAKYAAAGAVLAPAAAFTASEVFKEDRPSVGDHLSTDKARQYASVSLNKVVTLGYDQCFVDEVNILEDGSQRTHYDCNGDNNITTVVDYPESTDYLVIYVAAGLICGTGIGNIAISAGENRRRDEQDRHADPVLVKLTKSIVSFIASS